MVVLEVTVLLLLLLLLHRRSQVPKGMPPGTLGLPVIGWPPLGHGRKRQYFLDMTKKYGKIFTCQHGALRSVVLADAALIRRSCSNPHIQEKPMVFTFNINTHFWSLGVNASSGATWSANRKFLLRYIDVLGSSGAKQERVVSHEVAIWIHYLESLPLHKPVQIDWSINVAIMNVLFQLLASIRYDVDDQEMHLMNQAFNDNIIIGGGPAALLDIFPGLHRYLPNLVLNKLMKVDQLERNRDIIFGKFAKLIEEHRRTLDRSNPRDLIDHHLLEAEDWEGDEESPFTDERNLPVLLHDMFAAGSETVSSSTRWLILHLALNQEIQSKIHELIDAVVPKDRLPSLEDRDKLVYLDAVLMDVMRLSSLFPISVHKATQLTTLAGYTIPKDTIVMSSLESCHRDPSVWEKPDTLHPEHFLDGEGNLVKRREAFLPFSAGKRVCPGEALARVEMFLFASALLQKFAITPPPGETLEQYLTPNYGVLNLPRDFSICLTRRY